MTNAVELGDLDKLAQWLGANVAGFRGPLSAKKFASGQSNPTYLLESPSGRYVLRRKPPGVLLESAHAVDREFRAMSALKDSDVPVPRVYALCRDEDIVGTMFFVMEYLDGRTLFDPSLPDFDAAQRAELYDRQLRVLAALATLDIEAVGLADYGKHENYVGRQTSRWTKQYRASETERIEEMETLIDWVAANQPPETGKVALVHGDYRLDNMLLHPSQPQVLGVVDWELSTLGDPLVDVSYFATMLRLPSHPTHGGLAGLDRAALGIPEEARMLGRFCELSGLEPPPLWAFYQVFHCFRFVAILQGITKRYLDGNASNEAAKNVGAMARPIAQMGCGIIAQI